MSNDLKRYNIMMSINNNNKEIEHIDKTIKDNYKKIKDYNDCKDKKKEFIFGVILSSCFFGLALSTELITFINQTIFKIPFLTLGSLSLVGITLPKFIYLVKRNGFRNVDINRLNKNNNSLYEARNHLVNINKWSKEQLKQVEKEIELEKNMISPIQNNYDNEIVHEDIKIYVKKKGFK